MKNAPKLETAVVTVLVCVAHHFIIHCFLCKSQLLSVPLGKFQGPEYLAEKQGEQNRFSMMLTKVKGVQWCSNAAKLHYNELSFSSRENR